MLRPSVAENSPWQNTYGHSTTQPQPSSEVVASNLSRDVKTAVETMKDVLKSTEEPQQQHRVALAEVAVNSTEMVKALPNDSEGKHRVLQHTIYWRHLMVSKECARILSATIKTNPSSQGWPSEEPWRSRGNGAAPADLTRSTLPRMMARKLERNFHLPVLGSFLANPRSRKFQPDGAWRSRTYDPP